ncbi:DNA polymerase delta, subunit 4-domain-containing protein [Peziza echinospora]|nr:DNA polymerase delta, subunit 4-domain-containing protein [Peziza echinospora]
MPPTTRRSGASSRSSSQPHQHQQTLNFRTASKVTKPSAVLPGKHSSLEKKINDGVIPINIKEADIHDQDAEEKEQKIEPLKLEPQEVQEEEDEAEAELEPELEKVKPQPAHSTGTPSTTVRQPPPQSEIPLSSPSLTIPLPDQVLDLLKPITPSHITQYFNTTCLPPTARLTNPIHQKDLSRDEKILRHFDMTSAYGPCVGISRINRWLRAWRLGLKPPVEVLKVLVGVDEKVGGQKEGKMGLGVKKDVGSTGGFGKRDERMAYLDEELSTRNAKE